LPVPTGVTPFVQATDVIAGALFPVKVIKGRIKLVEFEFVALTQPSVVAVAPYKHAAVVLSARIPIVETKLAVEEVTVELVPPALFFE
jgi:hypothetical protein